MSPINWVRLIIGGIIASVILFVTDGIFHEHVVNGDWKALHDSLGIPEGKHSALGVLYFAVFELGRGFVSLFLYALTRPFFKAEDRGAGRRRGVVCLLSHRAGSVHSAGVFLERVMD
ncbi:MAG: hypothetical protein QOK48_2 [Blastocatellia bacterium]|jgi:hypothetical protein|nr:hypothetical protein [Blastocatellia bacterium]